MNAKPLTGFRIVDFSNMFAGPICSRFLLDCGAEVIKVEPPSGGDSMRETQGLTKLFAHFNAGKRSIALNLKHPDGRKLAAELIKEADIVIENFRPGVMQKLGLDYASFKLEFPELVYCSISGFGQTGPMQHRAAFAPIIHAASGFDSAIVSAQNNAEQPPLNWEIMVADILTGAYAFGAIQTAIISRLRYKKGGYLDVSMMESMMQMIPTHLQAAQSEPRPYVGRYCPVKTSDGYLTVCVITDKNMQNLCSALGREELAEYEQFSHDNRFENMEDLLQEIERWSKNLSGPECEAILNQAGVPCSIYQSPDDLFSHPQVLQRNVFSKVRNQQLGDFLIQNLPIKFSQFDSSTSDFVANLGEHTDEILTDLLKLDRAEIDRARSLGILG